MQPIQNDENQYHFFGLWLMAQAELRNMSIEQFTEACGLYHRTLANIIDQPDIRAEPETCIALARVTGEPLEKIYKVAGIEYQMITDPRALTVQKYFDGLTPDLKEEFLALIGHCEFDYQVKARSIEDKRLGFPVRWSFYEYLKKYFDTARANAAEFGLFANRTSFTDIFGKRSRSQRGNRYARQR